jgi:hypothetical protein
MTFLGGFGAKEALLARVGIEGRGNSGSIVETPPLKRFFAW